MNAINRLGLPDDFGYVLLIVAMVLVLAPYLRGSDFGIVKIPDFEPRVRRGLRIIGPLLMLAAILAHVPFEGGRSSASVAEVELPELGPGEPAPASAVSALESGTRVLVPRNEGQCLYAATVLGGDDRLVRVHFDFGGDGEVPRPRVMLADALQAEADVADRVYVALDRPGIYAPGTVKAVRDGRIQVDLDPDTDCAALYDRSFVLAQAAEERALIVEEKR